jgi:hypothetical protein
MSSFINTPKHFSTIKTNLARLIIYGDVNDRQKINFYLPYEMKNTHPIIYDNTYFVEEREKEIFNEIDIFAELQALCVCLQYKHHSDKLDEDIKVNCKEVKTIVKTERISIIALFKLIGCALYQVETEHIKELRALTKEEKRALQFMKDIHNEIAHHVVYNSKDFKNSNYSI